MTSAAPSGPIAFPRSIPFAETLGLELWAFGEGKAELRLPLTPALMNSMHVGHGGVVMTMLDVVMAHAARSADATATTPAGPGIVTIEMKTTFMRPAAHGPLRAVGQLLHGTASMAFTEGRVFDSADLLCAHATGTFKLVRSHARAARPAESPRAEAWSAESPSAESPSAESPSAESPSAESPFTPGDNTP